MPCLKNLNKIVKNNKFLFGNDFMERAKSKLRLSLVPIVRHAFDFIANFLFTSKTLRAKLC